MTQANRPFFNFRIHDLEAEFAERSGDTEFLRALTHELEFRSTPRAAELKTRVLQALSLGKQPLSHAGHTTSTADLASSRVREGGAVPPIPLDLARSDSPKEIRLKPPAPAPPITNKPIAVLDAWTALEVLSPQTFRRPEDLAAGGDRRCVAVLDGRLPWEGGGEKARPKTKLFYQVVLGTIDMEEAVDQLLARYTDSRAERPTARGEAVLAVVLVDRQGKLVEAPAIFVSSFGWGVPRAFSGDLAVLADWQEAEKPLLEGLDEILRRSSDEEEDLPLDHATIKAGYEWLVASLGLPRELVTPPRFALRTYEYFMNPDPPEPILLNSFYLNDLAMARTLFAEGQAPSNLRRYLGCEAPRSRQDLLQDNLALEAAVSPERIPPARWPGPGRNSLVLLQQAAVNLAMKELEDTGILAVNGPPGTGKTTLLRDLVAGIVTARAEAMAGFDDPATAFSNSREKLRAGQAWLHLYHLDPKLKGFEMLVASSNNKAVENVSAELPALKSVAEDATNLRYLSTLSDELLQCETWGLAAAVLGNAANRSRFKKTFWWNDEVGLSTYLAEAAGTPQMVERTDPETGKVIETCPPRIVSKEKPPRGHEEGLQRWKKARTRFRAALAMSREQLKELENLREMVASLPLLERTAAEAQAAEVNAWEVEDRARISAQDARVRLTEAEGQAAEAERDLAVHDETAPAFFGRLFRTHRAREWKSARQPLVEAREQTQKAMSFARETFVDSENRHRDALAKRESAERHRLASAQAYELVLHRVEAAREQSGDRFIDSSFFARGHEEKHKTVPWLGNEAQRTRDDLFVAAMALHRAFIDAAAKPLKHNLGALMSVMGGRTLPTAEKRALVKDLWSSLFLVVPLVSTTFASVERMLGKIPVEGLGWLFVDEAGQALPQAAMGALMRSRRAVVVGDPVQIEPIVMLPDTLTHAICRHFGVDPDRYNAPNASVQTLADAATPYYAEFEGKHGSRKVGVPLLVHRRCSEPMFGISNAVAYERLMVNSKAERPSPIGEILGPSAWIDVQGSAAEKWCPEEGEVVRSLLRSLAKAAVVPDLYLVTPFVIVAENLRKLVRESGVLAEWTDDPWKWSSERIGTVHTVQGREAEAVIFVLGAPAPHQTGARNWAGGRPNLLNVAVTRAKERLYVVGNHSLWREAGLFGQLASRLPVK